jgi:uncharacterized protein (TIRG00374 family)
MLILNKLFSYGWKIALGVALFIYIGTFVEWTDVYIKLKNILPVYALFGFVIVAFQAIVLGLRWQCIGKLDRINIPVLAYSRATLISFFFSQGLPASLGADAFRVWWYLRHHVDAARGLKVIAFDRIIGLVSLAGLCIASVVIFLSRGNNSTAVSSLAWIVVFSLLGFSLLVLPFRMGITPFLARLGSKLPAPFARALVWLIDIREHFRVGTKTELIKILILGISVHLLTVLLGFILARGLGMEISFFSCLAVIPPALLISYVPISIAGWGVREASFVFAFSLIGVSVEAALLISLGIGIVVLLISLLGGFLWASSGMRDVYMNEFRK